MLFYVLFLTSLIRTLFEWMWCIVDSEINVNWYDWLTVPMFDNLHPSQSDAAVQTICNNRQNHSNHMIKSYSHLGGVTLLEDPM